MLKKILISIVVILFALFSLNFVSLNTKGNAESNSIINNKTKLFNNNNNEYIWANKKSNFDVSELQNNSFVDDFSSNKNQNAVIFYDITWVASLHKYTPITHMIKTLEMNPNQTVFLLINRQSMTEEKLNLESLKQKFPNFNYEFYDRDVRRFNYHYYAMPIIKRLIQEHNLENSTKVLFASDHVFTVPAVELKTVDEKDITDFKNTFLDLFNFSQINIISDGTASNRFWSNSIFDYMRSKQIFNFDLQNKNYPSSIKFMEYFNKLDNNQKSKYIDKKEISIRDIIILWLTGSINSNSQYSKINFLVPSLETIIDINDPTSRQLTNNEKYFGGLFFNPYNSVNLNLIKLFQMLNPTSIKLLCDVLKIQDISNYESEFDNSNNYVYSTKLIQDDEKTLRFEANRIIKIFQDALNAKENIADKKIKIWIKHHPREFENTYEKLKEKIINLSSNEIKDKIINSLYYLEKSVPFEIYFTLKTFNNLQNRRKLNLYITFTTIAQLISANNETDVIKNIIVNEEDVKEITLRFGTNSKIFERSKFLWDNNTVNSEKNSFVWMVFGISLLSAILVSASISTTIILMKKRKKEKAGDINA